jgi:hypothetical protein
LQRRRLSQQLQGDIDADAQAEAEQESEFTAYLLLFAVKRATLRCVERKRIEEMLWAIHEANIGDLWETYEATKIGKDGKAEIDEAGKMLTLRKQRPRLLSDLSPDLCKVIENVDIDAKGNVIPRLYSKLQANRELRQMLNIGGQKERPVTDVSRLSDAELIQQLADQAKELGIEIDLKL